MFTDTHCHLYQEYYDNIFDIKNHAFNNNINRFIVSGVSDKSNREVMNIIDHETYVTIGIHPEEVNNYKETDLEYIKGHINDNHVIGIGEIGLDYHFSKEGKELQKKLFINQLKIASIVNKPVVIHSRDATEDTINILKNFSLKGVIHSFSGSYETACIYIKMGYVLGVNGVITFKNSNLKEVIKKVGIENIVLETDSPYLTPVPFRGQKNEPANIIEIAKYLSILFNMEMDEVSKITNHNIKRIFDI